MAAGADQQPVLDRGAVGDALRGLLDSSVRNRAGVSACVIGAAGIGKSYLIRSILAEVGVPSLVATGDHRRRNEPFAVLEQLTGPTGSDQDPAEVAFDRVDERCAAGPLVVWVDDAHHADAASLAGLRRLVWASRSLPLIVLLSARPTPVPEQLELLLRQIPTSFVLAPMNRMMVERLVLDRTGRWPGPKLRGMLELGAGNPLFVGEIIRALSDAGHLAPAGVDVVETTTGDPPRTALDGLIRDHLDALDDAGAELLSAVAVWGTAVALSDLGEVLYSEPAAMQPTVDRVVRTGIASIDAAANVDFAHDLFREVLYAGLPADVRRRLHRRIAAVLTDRRARPTLIAEHLLQAAATGQTTVAADSELLDALRTAVAATRQYAPQVAADLLEVADDLVARDDPAADQLALARARELFQAGRGVAAERLVQDRIRGVRDPAIAAGLHAVLITSQVNRADVDGALSAMDRTLAIQRLPADVRCNLRAQREWLLLLGGRFGDMGDLEADLAAARAVGHLPAEQTLVHTLACRAYAAGDPRRALAILEDHRATTDEQRQHQATGTALVWPVMFRLQMEGPVSGLALVQEAREEAAGHGSGWVKPFLGFVAGGAAFGAGDWDGAIAELDAALESAEETGTGWISIPTAQRAVIDARRGRREAARARIAAFRARRLPDQFGRGDIVAAEITLLEAEGALQAAGTLAQEFWFSARSGPNATHADFATEIVRTALLTIRTGLAAQVLLDVEQLPTGSAIAGTLELVRGAVRGDPDEIDAAAASFAHAGFVTRELAAREELACAAAAAGDRPRAVLALEQAVAGYERLRATVDRDRLLARMRALGIRRGPRAAHRTARTGWDSLTSMEQRITALIREGLTNREIGSRLFISPRTVQTHVSHVLEKTGLRSRVEVAAALR